MELIINILKVILLSLVIVFVSFHLGKFINDIQVKKFKEESDDKIILPEKDMCDSCKYLRFKNTDEEMKQDDVYRYKCSKFDEYYNTSPERCMFYSPSNRVKQSDITVNKNYKDDMFDIRPLLNSVSTANESSTYSDTYPEWLKVADWDDQYWTCSKCGYSVEYKRKKCPNCNSIMDNKKDTSNKEERAEWKKRTRHGDIFYECSHCGNWTHYMTKYCSQCNYPMEAGWKAWFVEHD